MAEDIVYIDECWKMVLDKLSPEEKKDPVFMKRTRQIFLEEWLKEWAKEDNDD